MIGALIGDIVGSVYEFDNVRSKQFPLFTEESFMTDDSIMTLAVAEIIQNKLYNDQDKVIDTLKKWGRAYPDRGYGGMFYKWLFTDQRESYNSFGKYIRTGDFSQPPFFYCHIFLPSHSLR